jgi:flavoprotein hydroxylase
MKNEERESIDADVIIVGAGPVGVTLGIFLAQQGWSVGVLERHDRPYALPRAIGLDDETARIFAAAGIGQELPALCDPVTIYDWQNAKGETLLHFSYPPIGMSGWPGGATFHQPALEEALARRAATLSPLLAVHRGVEVTDITDDGLGVTVRGVRVATQTEAKFRARYVIGCDGANSIVRRKMNVPVAEADFCHDWLVCDVSLREPREFSPPMVQICDPARPTTVVAGGPGRRRWEFMRGPNESLEELDDVATAWRLLRPFDVTPDNAILHRHVVYRFLAHTADEWRKGRMLLAGDAAHLMPPFAAQGMCSGIRDAINLAWKLDLVLRGVSGEALLDTYTMERREHVRHAIGMSLELGKVICQTDPETAARRDAAMIAAGADPRRILPPLPPPSIGTAGIVQRDASGNAVAPAGNLTPQARVKRGAVVDRFDDVVGRGFVLAGLEDPAADLSGAQLAFLAQIGARTVRITDADSASNDEKNVVVDVVDVDVDGVYVRHLRENGNAAVLVRPDFYLFGTAPTLAAIPALVDQLRKQLATAT